MHTFRPRSQRVRPRGGCPPLAVAAMLLPPDPRQSESVRPFISTVSARPTATHFNTWGYQARTYGRLRLPDGFIMLGIREQRFLRVGRRFHMVEDDATILHLFATLHQQHARLFGRHRPSWSRTRQALKEHRVSFRDREETPRSRPTTRIALEASHRNNTYDFAAR